MKQTDTDYIVKLPRAFFDDHAARDLPTPAVVRSTKTYVIVQTNDPAWSDLIHDAEHYASPDGPGQPWKRQAESMLAAVARHWDKVAAIAHRETLERLDRAELASVPWEG